MDTVTIDDEITRHYKIPFIKSSIFNEFEPRIQELLVQKSAARGYMLDIDAIETIVVYQKLLDAYLAAMKEAGEMVKKLFGDSGILYRLYDISFTFHGAHRLCMGWQVDGDHLAFELVFDDQNKHGAIPYLFRAFQATPEGEIIRGDATPFDANELSICKLLPDWFTDLLSKKQ